MRMRSSQNGRHLPGGSQSDYGHLDTELTFATARQDKGQSGENVDSPEDVSPIESLMDSQHKIAVRPARNRRQSRQSWKNKRSG